MSKVPGGALKNLLRLSSSLFAIFLLFYNESKNPQVIIKFSSSKCFPFAGKDFCLIILISQLKNKRIFI